MRRTKRIAWILTLAILLTLTVPALAASGVQNEVQGSAQLDDMMRDADDDKTREAIRRCMEQIERA